LIFLTFTLFGFFTVECASTKSLISGVFPLGSGIIGTGLTIADDGLTRPANLVRMVTYAIPIGISADNALDIIAVMVDALGP
jgi:hypothetical protein